MKRLSLNEITNIAEVIGAVAIVISLIFVGLQIRQNTKQAEATALQTNLTYVNSINDLAQSPDTAAVWLKGLNDFDALSPVEKVRFDGMMFNVLNRYMPVGQLHEQGQVSDRTYDQLTQGLALILRSPGAMQWWMKTRQDYPSRTTAFYDYVIKQYPKVKPLSEHYKFGE